MSEIKPSSRTIVERNVVTQENKELRAALAASQAECSKWEERSDYYREEWEVISREATEQRTSANAAEAALEEARVRIAELEAVVEKVRAPLERCIDLLDRHLSGEGE